VLRAECCCCLEADLRDFLAPLPLPLEISEGLFSWLFCLLLSAAAAVVAAVVVAAAAVVVVDQTTPSLNFRSHSSWPTDAAAFWPLLHIPQGEGD